MLHRIYAESPHREQIRMKNNQIAYTIENHKKFKRVKIKFGDEIAEKCRFFNGEHLQVDWEDHDRLLYIYRADTGYLLMKPKNQKWFIMFVMPKKCSLPAVKKLFNNILIDGQKRITLDFSLIKI